MKRLIKGVIRKAVEPILEDDMPEFDRKVHAMFATPSLFRPWREERDRILAECNSLIGKSQPLMPHQYRHLLTDIATTVCRYAWPFAASEDHHHHHMGGLVIHSCETMLTALTIFNQRYTPELVARELAEDGEQVRYMLANKQFERVGFAVALAALAHDLGKMFDQTIAIGRPGIYFYALSSLPEIWLAKNNVDRRRAHIAWHAEREAQRHAVSSVGLLLHLLTPHMHDKKYAPFIGAFMAERAFPLDRESRTIPLKNFPKIATYLHLTNLAILHHNDMNYHDPHNFVLGILRQSDSDSTEEWENKNAISLVDFIRKFFTEQFGGVVRANAAADLTVYVRKSGRYILVPRQRFYKVFLQYLETFGKTLNVKDDMFARELTRHRIAVPLDEDENRFEPLQFTVRVPSISHAQFDTLVLDTVTLGIGFDTDNPALPIYYLGSNDEKRGTRSLFQFTQISRDKEPQEESAPVILSESGDKAQDKQRTMSRDDARDDKQADTQPTTQEPAPQSAPSHAVDNRSGNASSKRAASRKRADKVQPGNDDKRGDDVREKQAQATKSPRKRKQGDDAAVATSKCTEDDGEAAPVQQGFDEILGAEFVEADKAAGNAKTRDEMQDKPDDGDSDDTAVDATDAAHLLDLMTTGNYDPSRRSAMIESLAELVASGRLSINDKRMTFTVLLPAGTNEVHVRLKELVQSVPDYGPLFKQEIEHIVRLQREGMQDAFHRKIQICKVNAGKKGRVASDYHLICPRWATLPTGKGGGAFKIVREAEPRNAVEVLNYCGLEKEEK